MDEPDILDLTTRLVDKSLVLFDERNEQARYQLPETVRQYAGVKLQEAGESDESRTRHRNWYLALVESAYSEFLGVKQIRLLERLETEHDNLRAALDWSKAEKDGAEAELRLVGALFPFWNWRGHWNEGRTRMEEALARIAEAPPSAATKVLRGAGHLAWKQGDYEWATTLAERGLALCRDFGHCELIPAFLRILGLAASRQGNYDRAKVLHEQELEGAKALGSKLRIGWALNALGTLAMRQGRYERATELFGESLTLFQEIGEVRGSAYGLFDLGDVTLRQGDHRRAAALFAKSLILCRQAGERGISQKCLEGWAGVFSAEGDYLRAARLLGAAEAVYESLGSRYSPAEQVDYDQRVASTRAALEGAAFAAAWAEGQAMTLEQAIEYALTVEAN